MGTYSIIHTWCFDGTLTAVEIFVQSVQLNCEKLHSRSCEFRHYVRLDYIRSTERLIWDPAKFSHTRFLADRSELKEATAGQNWSEANIQHEPVGEEPLNNSNNNNTLHFSLNHFPYPPPSPFILLTLFQSWFSPSLHSVFSLIFPLYFKSFRVH